MSIPEKKSIRFSSKRLANAKSKSLPSGEVYHMFEFLKDENDRVSMKTLIKKLHDVGIRECDIRFQNVKKQLPDILGREIENFSELTIDTSEFMRLLLLDTHLFMGAISETLIIPKFIEFVDQSIELFQAQCDNNKGECSTYIPQYEHTDPNLWGVSICTIDGQRCGFGDANVPFPTDSITFPLLYAKCIDLFNEETVHAHINQRRRPQETFKDLPTDAKPYNAMVSSGAIALSALFCDPDLRPGSSADRHQEFFEYLKDLCCTEHLQINSTVYISHKTKGDKYRAMVYAMQSTGYISKDVNPCDVLDFFFEINAMEVTCDSMSIIAATLANYGKNPFTYQQVIKAESVKHVLSAMLKWGCTSYSGISAFNLGLPCKQSESGAFILVVPGLLGLALYSPRLCRNTISPRNIEFAQSFVEEFSLHPLNNVVDELKKKPPFIRVPKIQCENHCAIFKATVDNDITEIMNLTCGNKVLAYATDSEGRTILHVAAALGFVDIVKYVATNYWRLSLVRDKFERSPRDYVEKIDENEEILNILIKYEKIAESNILPD